MASQLEPKHSRLPRCTSVVFFAGTFWDKTRTHPARRAFKKLFTGTVAYHIVQRPTPNLEQNLPACDPFDPRSYASTKKSQLLCIFVQALAKTSSMFTPSFNSFASTSLVHFVAPAVCETCPLELQRMPSMDKKPCSTFPPSSSYFT